MIFFIITIFIIILVIISYKLYEKKSYIWLPNYLMNKFYITPKYDGLKHIIFLFVNHFEPPLGETHIGKERMRQWLEKYPQIALRHKDADGKVPQHTWFYPFDELKDEESWEELKGTAKLCESGFGEIELHLHHHDDTPESLREKFEDAKVAFKKVGALTTIDNKQVFAFIHGGWALDNSIITKGKNRCGVNNELMVLKEAGCFADFTFPAVGTSAQPQKINSIYYALDDPKKPKSYNKGIDVEVGKKSSGDLMIFEGPLTINWQDWRHIFYPALESGEILGENPPTKNRIDQWIRCNIHVKGRPEWTFVKIFCHGGYDSTMSVVLGNEIDEMLTYLESKYNDGRRYKLHYVTAREAYNIVKAAEDGKNGDPDEYRDFIIKPYLTKSVSVSVH